MAQLERINDARSNRPCCFTSRLRSAIVVMVTRRSKPRLSFQRFQLQPEEALFSSSVSPISAVEFLFLILTYAVLLLGVSCTVLRSSLLITHLLFSLFYLNDWSTSARQIVSVGVNRTRCSSGVKHNGIHTHTQHHGM